MNNVVLFSVCEWSKDTRTLRLCTEYGLTTHPHFYVESDRTGNRVKFIALEPGDKDFDEDGWDGEFSIYKPVTECGVDRFVVYNQY